MAPLQGTQRRSLHWLMILNIAMNEYFQSVRKSKHSKLKELPETDARTRGTNQQIPLNSWQMIGVQSLFTIDKETLNTRALH